jgi:hypothetical protein
MAQRAPPPVARRAITSLDTTPVCVSNEAVELRSTGAASRRPYDDVATAAPVTFTGGGGRDAGGVPVVAVSQPPPCHLFDTYPAS